MVSKKELVLIAGFMGAGFGFRYRSDSMTGPYEDLVKQTLGHVDLVATAIEMAQDFTMILHDDRAMEIYDETGDNIARFYGREGHMPDEAQVKEYIRMNIVACYSDLEEDMHDKLEEKLQAL